MITLSPESLAKFKLAANDRGQTDSNDYLHEQLHETAVDVVDDILIAADRDVTISDIDDDQRDELVQSYKDGFWEPTHLGERNALRAAIKRLLECPDLNLGNLETESIEAINQANTALLP